MRKYVPLMLVAALALATAAHAADLNLDPLHKVHQYFRMWVDISESNVLTVNFYRTSPLLLLGDSTANGAGGFSNYGTKGANAGDVQMSNDSAEKTHMGIVISTALPNWSVSIATNNDLATFPSWTDVAKGGLIRATAVQGAENRIDILWHNTGTHATVVDFNNASPAGWSYTKDLNETTWATDKLGYARLAWGLNGNATAKYRNDGAPDGDIDNVTHEFFTMLGSNISGKNAGQYSCFPQVVLYAQ